MDLGAPTVPFCAILCHFELFCIIWLHGNLRLLEAILRRLECVVNGTIKLGLEGRRVLKGIVLKRARGL